jgi:hypothetical protein
LLEARVIITSYNDHVRLLSFEPFVGLAPQSLLGPGSRHCYGIITIPTSMLVVATLLTKK